MWLWFPILISKIGDFQLPPKSDSLFIQLMLSSRKLSIKPHLTWLPFFLLATIWFGNNAINTTKRPATAFIDVTCDVTWWVVRTAVFGIEGERAARCPFYPSTKKHLGGKDCFLENWGNIAATLNATNFRFRCIIGLAPFSHYSQKLLNRCQKVWVNSKKPIKNFILKSSGKYYES